MTNKTKHQSKKNISVGVAYNAFQDLSITQNQFNA